MTLKEAYDKGFRDILIAGAFLGGEHLKPGDIDLWKIDGYDPPEEEEKCHTFNEWDD